MTCKLTTKQNNKEEVKKKKIIALKSITNKKAKSDKSDQGDKEDDMALVTRKFRMFMRRKR